MCVGLNPTPQVLSGPGLQLEGLRHDRAGTSSLLHMGTRRLYTHACSRARTQSLVHTRTHKQAHTLTAPPRSPARPQVIREEVEALESQRTASPPHGSNAVLSPPCSSIAGGLHALNLGAEEAALQQTVSGFRASRMGSPLCKQAVAGPPAAALLSTQHAFMLGNLAKPPSAREMSIMCNAVQSVGGWVGARLITQ